ncbi:Serine protease Do-like HtrA [Rubripirellula tenax]|uniref:Serine protease Do-like HtrA n=1 Tax=Rubripirellula tenax TaxID=2528015 RepID=A0A5C6FEQ8_9BACT|nr:PDZ domain-containing protein [Rubripirellula tenax]TWU60296.1 Serine protease Do-like HtrA [Rubripirellula tenax]
MKRNFQTLIAARRLFAAAVVVTLVTGVRPGAFADESAKSQAEQTKVGEGSIAYWVTQLSSDHYLRRETAAQKLAEAGTDAVADLINVIRTGDLETVERASDVVTKIAMSGSPSDDGGAWKHLNELSKKTVGRAASRAESAVQEIRKHRSNQARTELAAAGVYVGMDEFVIQAISQRRLIVQVDDKWNRNVESLQWLEWLDGVENARVQGAAINADVLKRIALVPELKSLAIVDGLISDETLQPLMEMKPLSDLEFRYVHLTDEQGDLLAHMPVRVSLNLMGTGISADKVESMRAAAPGLRIEHRQGGFLGVTCQDSFDVCQISGVVSKSAAEDAGLIRGDVITRLDDTVVRKFKDLQDAINEHLPGDTVKITFRRAEAESTVELKLRRFEE